MATKVTRSVSVFIESGEAEKAQQRLQAKTKQLADDLKKATDPVVINRLTKELKTAEGQLERVSKKVNGEVTPSFKDLQSTVNALGRRLKTMSTTDADFSKVLIQYNKAKVELGEMRNRVDRLNEGFNNSSKSSSGLFNGFAGFAKGVGLLAVAQIGIDGISSLITGSIEEFQQAELAAARFEARLKNLGQSDAIPRLTQFAEELAAQFKFLDNDDIIGVFEQFINYGKLTEEQIRELTPVVIDFAAQQQISVGEAASVIIKALEGNGKALKEYGIDIKGAKNETEAFGVILTQLKPKVEGAAQTFSETMAGGAATARQEIANLKEELGENLQPLVKGFYEVIGGIVRFISDGITGIKEGFADMTGSITIAADTILRGPLRLLGFNLPKPGEKLNPSFTGASQAVVNAEVQRFLAADKEKQKAILDALKVQYRQNIDAYNKAIRENDKAAIETYARLVNTDAGIIRAINAANKNKPTLGLNTGGGNTGGGKGGGGKSQAQIEREREAEERKRLDEDLKKQAEDLFFFNADQITKELRAVDEKYNQLRIRAKGNADQLKEIDDLNARERQLVFKNYYNKLQAEADKNAEELRKKADADAQKLKELFEKRQLAALDFARQQLEESAKKGVQSLRDDAEIKVMQSRGFARQKALREQLKLEEELEVSAAETTGDNVEKIREKYRERERQLLQEQIEKIAGYIEQGMQAVTQLFNAISERENQRLDDNRRRYDRERENYDRLLNSQKISREEYDKRITAINRKQEAEEKALRLKQFNREKALNLVNAIMNTALAVTRALTTGNPFAAALAAAFGAVQVGIIASQKPPQFAKGGILKGPRHSNGGMPVVNPVTGSVEAEVEGGEAILSRRFVRNNPNLVAAALESSRNGGYNIESPFNKTGNIRPMNVGLITNSMGNVRRYESGGILPQANTQLQQENTQLRDVLMRLSKQLEKPFVGVVSLSTIEDANDRKTAIIEDATMK